MQSVKSKNRWFAEHYFLSRSSVPDKYWETLVLSRLIFFKTYCAVLLAWP